MKRLPAIDVVRGLAVVFMVMHHTVDSWVMDSQRQGLVFAGLRHLGGIPAPAFMVLAGLSSALIAARERAKGASTARRMFSGVKRGLYILGIAFVFRLFCFYAGGNTIESGAWPILFRVDILNSMGAALIVVSLACAPAKNARGSIVIALGLAAIFGLSAPLLENVHFTFPSTYIGNYLTGNSVMVLFPLFPWLSYLAVGYAMGEHVAKTVAGSSMPGPASLALATRPFIFIGIACFAGGLALSEAPFALYPAHDYWHTSPLWVIVRLGVQMLLLTGFAWALRADTSGKRAGFLQLLGRHSLLAYVFHVELVYGRASSSVIRQATIPFALMGVTVLLLICAGLALGSEWRDEWRARKPAEPLPVAPVPAVEP